MGAVGGAEGHLGRWHPLIALVEVVDCPRCHHNADRAEQHGGDGSPQVVVRGHQATTSIQAMGLPEVRRHTIIGAPPSSTDQSKAMSLAVSRSGANSAPC